MEVHTSAQLCRVDVVRKCRGAVRTSEESELAFGRRQKPSMSDHRYQKPIDGKDILKLKLRWENGVGSITGKTCYK